MGDDYWGRKDEFERTGKWPPYKRKDGTYSGQPTAKEVAAKKAEEEDKKAQEAAKAPGPALFDDSDVKSPAQFTPEAVKEHFGCSCLGGRD